MTGFPPAIDRYLKTLDKKTRQDVVNQLASLGDNDMQRFEAQLEQKFGMQSQQNMQQQQAQQMTQQQPQQNQQMQDPQEPAMARGGNFESALKYMDSVYAHYADGGNYTAKEREEILSKKAERTGMDVQAFANHVMANTDKYDEPTILQAKYSRNLESKYAKGGRYDDGAEFTNNPDGNPNGDPNVATSNGVPTGIPNPNFATGQNLGDGTNSIPSVVVRSSAISPAVKMMYNGSDNVNPTNQSYRLNEDGVPIRGNEQPMTPEKAKEVAQEVKTQEKNVANKVTDVLEIQKALKDAGYDIKADGIYGKKTAAAVKQFQKTSFGDGADVDGIVGKNTAMALLGYNNSDWGDRMYKDNPSLIVRNAKQTTQTNAEILAEAGKIDWQNRAVTPKESEILKAARKIQDNTDIPKTAIAAEAKMPIAQSNSNLLENILDDKLHTSRDRDYMQRKGAANTFSNLGNEIDAYDSNGQQKINTNNLQNIPLDIEGKLIQRGNNTNNSTVKNSETQQIVADPKTGFTFIRNKKDGTYRQVSLSDENKNKLSKYLSDNFPKK